MKQAMTTNDIAIVAELFGVSPYQFIRDARAWREGTSWQKRLESQAAGVAQGNYSNITPFPTAVPESVRGPEDTDDIPENVEEEWAGEYAADPSGDDPIDHGAP